MKLEKIEGRERSSLLRVVLDDPAVHHTVYTKVSMFLRSMVGDSFNGRFGENVYFPKSGLTVCIRKNSKPPMDHMRKSYQRTCCIMADDIWVEADSSIYQDGSVLVNEIETFTSGLSTEDEVVHSLCGFVEKLGVGPQ